MANQLPARVHTYQNHTLDSTRWDAYQPRPDDIVIATSYKSGTAWMQEIVRQLVFVGQTVPQRDAAGLETRRSDWRAQRRPGRLSDRTRRAAPQQTWTLFGQFVQHNGGNAWAAKHLRTWLRAAGFTQVEMSAAYECYGTSSTTATWSDAIVAILADLAPRMIEAGLTDHATVEQLSAAWQAWGKHPDAFLGRSWCEAIGWGELVDQTN